MEQELLRKTRSKRRRTIGIIIVIAVFAALAVLGMNIERGGQGDNTSATNEAGAALDKTLTMEISCSELSENMDRLTDKAVEDYIPKDGKILAPTEVAFAEGESVYDCLYRICRQKDIQLESSYDSVYKSRYIEGIGHLYEKDAGKMSGWVYEVDGKQPDYGCSSYKPKGGEKVLWKYVTDSNK